MDFPSWLTTIFPGVERMTWVAFRWSRWFSPYFQRGFAVPTTIYGIRFLVVDGSLYNYWPRAVQMPWRRGAQGRLCQIWRYESCGAGSDVEIEIWYHATYIYIYTYVLYIYMYYIYVCIILYIYVCIIYMCIIYIYMYTCICHTYIYIFHYIPFFWIGCVWSCIQLYGLRGDTPTMGLLDRPLDGEH